MKNVVPTFKRPIKSKDEPRTDVSHWDKAMDAYDAKDHRKTIIETINYMNPSLLWGKETNGNIEIDQGQGSAQIHVKVTNDKFLVKAPFLKITENTNKVALFRKIGEINFNPLTLAQIRLRNDTLWFEYEMPVTLAQPYKIYDVLREICVYADDYDDEFVEKYKAGFYQEPNVTPLSEEEKEKVWQQINTILTEWKEYVAFFKEKRWDAFQWDITVISILKIVNMPYVHGNLRTKLQEYVHNLFNGKIDFNHRIDKGNNFMQKLCAKTKDEYMKDIYHAEAFVSLKWRSSTQILQDDAKNMERNVAKYVKDRDNLMLCYYLQYSFLHILYNFNVEEVHKNAIYDVLEEVSGKELHIAAPKLLKTYYGFLDGNTKTSSKSGSKKGLFAKLFG
ncbi:T3SS (YopN, CesT) and YbjN peptide-binding chaperone 1 [Costertonia aggregata]|uniref:TY-Chap central domain-containing protein n=1 Tax=Costertonia aggregata TaxID=343403 RepID=A0A7H9AKY7_9FLAO|nr:hypothetical protein [Costertonia aggregata]QLG44129.1 hypothetical protein HYG79_01770 [Costertonia aggregata]